MRLPDLVVCVGIGTAMRFQMYFICCEFVYSFLRTSDFGCYFVKNMSVFRACHFLFVFAKHYYRDVRTDWGIIVSCLWKMQNIVKHKSNLGFIFFSHLRFLVIFEQLIVGNSPPSPLPPPAPPLAPRRRRWPSKCENPGPLGGRP